jgi:hypothetical protein
VAVAGLNVHGAANTAADPRATARVRAHWGAAKQKSACIGRAPGFMRFGSSKSVFHIE